MTQVLIAYISEMKHTGKLAEAAAEGVKSAGGSADLRPIPMDGPMGVTLEDMVRLDALLLGSPVHHRSMHYRLKQFIEDVVYPPYIDDQMVGKVGAVFSCGGGHGSAGAGVEVMQLGILAALAGNGMVLVPFPKCTPGFDETGSHWGPHARCGGPKMEPQELTAGATDAVFHHAANVTKVAAALKGLRLATGNVAPAPGVKGTMVDDANQRAKSVGAV